MGNPSLTLSNISKVFERTDIFQFLPMMHSNNHKSVHIKSRINTDQIW